MKENLKLVLLTPLRSILFIISGLLLLSLTNKPLVDLASWWSVICSIVNIVTIIILLYTCKSEGLSFSKLINYNKEQVNIKSIIKGILVTLIVGFSGMYLAGIMVYNQLPYVPSALVQPLPLLSLAILNLFVLPITSAIAEDGIYLGYTLNKLEKKTQNKWIILLIPIFFYTLQHCFFPLIFNLQYMLYRFLSILPLIAVYSLWYYKKRNLIPIMSGHFVINLLSLLQIVLISM